MVSRNPLAATLCTLALTAVVVPVAAQPQHRIGVLGVAVAGDYARQVEAFRAGLRDLGYIEGRDVVIEYRWADGEASRLADLAAELVRHKPDVIVTSGPGTAAAKNATRTIPIVMAAAGDAVAAGLVASLPYPGGNVTGSSFLHPELNIKRLELLKEALPGIRRVGLLLVGSADGSPMVPAVQNAAQKVSLELNLFEVRSPADFQDAFATMRKAGIQALVVPDQTILVAQATRIAQLAAQSRLPMVGSVELAKGGALLGYGVDFPYLWHKAAHFVDRIFKGAKPADLPVEQPTRFEVVVNLKAAKALGIGIPNAVRIRASQTID